MNVNFTRNDQPIAQGQKQPVDRDWFRFLRDLWRGAGFDASVPMYGDLYVSPSAMGDITGGAVLTSIGGPVGRLFPASADTSVPL